jgi:tRNA(Ile)-lysidine synthase TilS/MesJ
MRRGFLYATAQKLGCNKIALGHHMSDVVETTLMSMLFGAQFKTMLPKLNSKNFPGMQLIRPMYCIEETAILAWKRYNSLSFIQCACPLSENCNIYDAFGGTSARQTVKNLIVQLKKDNKDVEKSVFQSLQMINLETVIGYKLNGEEYRQ